MKRALLAGICFLPVVLMTGCSGFWDYAGSSTTTTTTTKSSGYFYVLNSTTATLAGYYISSGSLTKISGSPYSLTGTPYAIAMAPSGNFLYVSTSSGIYLYTIASNGVLTSQGLVFSDTNATALAISGSWLIEADLVSTTELQLIAYAIDSSTGASQSATEYRTYTFTYSSSTVPTVKQMVISPNDDYLFVALGTGGTIAVPFTTGNTDPMGATAKLIPASSNSGSALSVAVDPSERLFYIGETLAASSASTGGVRVFEYSSLSGTLTQASGSPIASGSASPNAILPEATGNYVYVANSNGSTSDGVLKEFAITESSSTYTITAKNSYTSGIVPKGLAEDSDDNFVLVASSGGSTSAGSPDLEALSMSSGALTANITSTTGSDPTGAIAIVAKP